MSFLSRVGAAVPLNAAQSNVEARTSVLIVFPNTRPTAEQVADALLASQKLSQADLNAIEEAGGGDYREQLIAHYRKHPLEEDVISYAGGGKYAARVVIPEETRQGMITWSKTDGDAPPDTPPSEPSVKVQELAQQGIEARDRAELAMRTAEAKQQLAESIIGKGRTETVATVGATMSRELPKLSPTMLEAAPVVIGGAVLAGGTAALLRQQIGGAAAVWAVKQMEQARQPPPGTSAPTDVGEQPSAPSIPSDDELPKGELVPQGRAAPPSAPSQSTQPTTPQGAPEPSGKQPIKPGDVLPPIIAGAGGAATGVLTDHMAGANKEGKRVTVGRRASSTEINSVAEELAAKGIKVVKNADKQLDKVKLNAAAAFNYEKGELLLRKDATFLELFHEKTHALQWADLGREAYKAKGALAREEHVYDTIMANKHLFSQREIEATQAGIDWYRIQHSHGVID